MLGVRPAISQQKMDGFAKQQAIDMLSTIKGAIKKEYYDPTFGGIDIDARFKAAEEKLRKADYLGQAFAIIGQAVMDLNDSHTRFWPPARNMIVEYGWRMKLYGDSAFITAVKEKSDAFGKGLRIGDEVVKVNGFRPSRKELWKMIYYYQTINPQTKIVLDVKSPAGEVRQLSIDAQVTQLKRVFNFADHMDVNQAAREYDKVKDLDRHYFKDYGTALVWKMPNFAFEPKEVPDLMARAAGKQALVLDLRGNPGGYVVTLEKLAGYFFEKDTKIADLKGRKQMDPQMAKSQGAKGFTGKVFVLIDSNSASAAEIFARLMQIEKRGVVIGDISAGAVMQSHPVNFDAGVTNVISYGLNMTMADVVMSDGKSLEHVGVTPDEVIVPSGKDLAERRDRALSRALQLAGLTVDDLTAGHIFPVEPFVERQSNVVINFSF